MDIRRLAFATGWVVAIAAGLILLMYPSDPPPFREASISGVVLSPSGSPMPGATVYMVYNQWEDPKDLHPSGPRGRSDSAGGFRVDGVPFGTRYLIAFHDSCCQSDAVEVTVSRPEVSNIKVQLTVGGQIRGTVRPSQGKVAGRQIYIYSHRGDIGWQSTKSDSEGRFSFDKVIAQDYIIELKPEGYPEVDGNNQAKNVRKPIKVAKRQTTDVVFGKE